MAYIADANINGTTYKVGSSLYGTCDTAAATAAKVVTMAGFDTLTGGVTIHVKFTYANGVASPTLNVNSTGAKNIYKYGTTTPGTNADTSWPAGGIVSFTYDATANSNAGGWIMNDWNNTWSLSDAVNSTSSTVAATSKAVKAAYDLAASKKTGTVTSVATGAGLTGGTITTSGTLKANLASETALTNAAVTGTDSSNRLYPVAIDKNGKLAVNVPWTNTTVSTTGSGNAITAISDNGSGVLTATKSTTFLTGHQTIKQDGVTGATANRFGTCGTAAATAAKTVSVTSGTFALEAGSRVTVKFTYTNTADSPTLNVNSTGAKNIFHRGAQITTGANKGLLIGAVDFVYDGTQWHLIGDTQYAASTTSIGSASTGTAIAADDITAWTTNTPTAVTSKTVVTGGSTTDVPNISKKTVVTAATAATASYANGVLTISNGSVTTGDSVTVGTAIKAYTSLTTGASVTVTAGTAASLSYTARSIPNISVTSKTVATGVSGS